MITPKNETEDLLLSITKNCETVIEQTHKKADETLDIEITKPREIYHFKPPIQVEGSWMLGLTHLDVYNSIITKTEENNKFELYTGYLHDEVSYIQFKDNIAKVFGLPSITPGKLSHEIFGP